METEFEIAKGHRIQRVHFTSSDLGQILVDRARAHLCLPEGFGHATATVVKSDRSNLHSATVELRSKVEPNDILVVADLAPNKSVEITAAEVETILALRKGTCRVVVQGVKDPAHNTNSI